MNLLTIQSYALLDIPKIHTDLLWDLTLLFSILAVVYLGVIFFFRNKFTSKSRLVSERKKQLSPMISEFLFFEPDAASDEDYKNYIHLKIEIRDLIKDEFNHQILSDILIDLQKDVSGETLERLYKLFKDLGLHLKAFDKLRSYRWQVVSQGIMELTQMRVTESYSFITKFINDKRGTVRKQAELAAVSLEEKGIAHFLDTTRYQISEWQQLKLMDVLRNREDFQPPRFRRWLTSNNKAVVLFSLRLLKFYDQNDANATLVQLVRHKNKKIKEEAIGCIQKFGVVEALDTLKLVFWKSTVNSKILILDTICELGDKNDIPFLQDAERKSFNFIVKSKALSSIHMLAPETALDTADLEDQNNYLDTSSHEIAVANQENKAWDEEVDARNLETKDTEETPIEEEALPDPLPFVPPVIIEETIEKTSEGPPEPFQEPEELEEPMLPNKQDQAMKEEKKEKQTKESFMLSMEDLKNLEVISDEILYSLDFESLDQYLKEVPNLDDFVEKEKQEPSVRFKPDFNGLRLDKDRTASIDNFYEDVFSQKDDCDKNILLDTIYDVGDEREIPILKMIIINEENIGIRDKALKILNGLTDKNYWYSEEEGAILEIEKIRERCIFKPLFQHSDRETRLILLEQIAEIGDTKELIFLKALEIPEDVLLKNKMASTLAILTERLQLQVMDKEEEMIQGSSPHPNEIESIKERIEPDEAHIFPDILNLDKDIPIVKNDPINIVENFQSTKGKMPLDFCFLLGSLEISPSKSTETLEIDFELESVNKNLGIHKNIDKDEEKKGNNATMGLLEQFLSLPSKIKDIFNG